MSMRPDQFCGNCGAARSPDGVFCSQCGVPYETSDEGFVSSTGRLHAPTQVASTPPQAFWPPSAPTYQAGTLPVPPTSSRRMTRLLIVQGVLIVTLLMVILVVLLHPFGDGNGSPSGTGASALSTATLIPAPTATPTPLYAKGLASHDIDMFARALGEALQNYDAASINPYILMPFTIVCDEGSDYGGQCDTSWEEVQNQINKQALSLDILTQGLDLENGYTLASYCPGVTTYDSYLLIGSFEQETQMPLAHLGTAVLGISCSCGSAPNPLLDWDAVYFC